MKRWLCGVAAVCLICAGGFGADPEPGGLEKAERLEKEQSYSLAATEYRKLLDEHAVPTERRREITYRYAMALTKTSRAPREEIAKLLESLTAKKASDVWAGRAHWKLEPGMQPNLFPTMPAPQAEHLRAAERILSANKAPDLAEFYWDVLEKTNTGLYYEKKKDREFLFSFYDKLLPLIKGDKEATARALLQRANHLNAVEREKDLSAEKTRQLQALLNEFPDTKSAPEAMLSLIRVQLEGPAPNAEAARKQYAEVMARWPDSEQAEQAKAELEKLNRKSISMQLQDAYCSDEPLKIKIWSRNLESADLTAIPFEPEQLLRDSQEDYGQLVLWLKHDNQLKLAPKGSAPQPFQAVALGIRNDLQPTTKIVELARLKPGAYLLEAAGGDVKSRQFLLISNLMLVEKASHGTKELWCVDARTGEPRPGTAITIAWTEKGKKPLLGGNKEPKETLRFKGFETDTNGMLRVPEIVSSGWEHCIIGRDGPDIAVKASQPVYVPSIGSRSPEFYGYTDRPVYRPGQKVSWRAILRERESGVLKNLAQQQVSLQITDARGQTTDYGTVMSNAYGAVNGEFPLDAKAVLGGYAIGLKWAGYSYPVRVAEFQVDEYKKPEFEVKVTTSDTLHRAGGKARAEVEARYYFGEPVKNAAVKYVVRRRDRYWLPWRGASDAPGTTPSWFGAQAEAENSRDIGQEGAVVAEGSGQTDLQGKLAIEFKTPVPEVKSERYWQPSAWDFVVQVTVTDQSRRNIDASASVLVSRQAAAIEAKAGRPFYRPGENVEVQLRAFSPGGSPVPVQGKLYVQRAVRDANSGKETVTTLSTQRAEIGRDGEVLLSWQSSTAQQGRLRFLFEAKDRFGARSRVYEDFLVADEATPPDLLQIDEPEVLLGKDTYDVGDVAELIVLTKDTGPAWFWVQTGQQDREEKVIRLTSSVNRMTIPVTPEMSTRATINVVTVHDKRMHHSSSSFSAVHRAKTLIVVAKPDKANYRPGEEGTMEIEARDAAGRPVSAEFSVTAYDRSLEVFARKKREDIRHFFYGRVYGSPTASVSASMYPREFSDYEDHGGDGGCGGELPARPAPPPAPCAPGMTAPGDEVKARKDFRDSAYWSPSVVTDKSGKATIRFTYPESLTSWQLEAVGVTAGDTLVGNASAESRTRKNLMVRLEAPRFFTERDQAFVSAIVHSYLASPVKARVRVSANAQEETSPGTAGVPPTQTESAGESPAVAGKLELAKGSQNEAEVDLVPGGETRLDVPMNAVLQGKAKLRAQVVAGQESDAMELTVPILPHGIDKLVAWNGTSDDVSSGSVQVDRTGDSIRIVRAIEIPSDRTQGTGKLTLQVAPSIVSAVRDAIPFMIDYPYGCVEQTMSRFMPAALAEIMFEEMKLPGDERLQDLIEKVTEKSLDRLKDFQKRSGGWGWWKDDTEDAYNTAYVVYGLSIVRDAVGQSEGLDELLAGGRKWLRGFLKKLASDKTDGAQAGDGGMAGNGRMGGSYEHSRNVNAAAFALFAMSRERDLDKQALDLVWNRRGELSPQTMAMLARTLWRAGRKDDALVVMRNLQNFAKPDAQNDTIQWGGGAGSYYWWNNDVESTAHCLMAYLEIQPDDRATAQAMKWLLLSRHGKQWQSTRDTAYAVMALSQYVRAKSRGAASMDISVRVGSLPPKSWHVAQEDYWNFKGQVKLEGDAIPEGRVPVTITANGGSTVFYTIAAEYYSRAEGVEKAGHMVQVDRVYERVVKVGGGKGKDNVKYAPVRDGEQVRSGDEFRVTLQIEAATPLEYLMVEDPKPAGMEPMELQSGMSYGDGLCSNMELRDEKVAFFISHLWQGKHAITYRCRAETPGVFHTMPAKCTAMYSPYVQANSDELRVGVK